MFLFRPIYLDLSFALSLRSISSDMIPRGLSDMSPFPLVPRGPLGPASVPILLSEVEQEQKPSGNGDREAVVVGAGLFDGEGERAYIVNAPHYIFAFRTHIKS